MIKKGLGRGLGALLEDTETDKNSVTEIDINKIEPSSVQPRKYFNDDKLREMSESIKQHGIVQPLIVRKENDTYKIVAGERRWRAARIAGLKKVPVIMKELSDREVMEIALIENLQREDLNPIEEAEAYDRLINEFDMTQEEISKTVGKSRSAVANCLRLLTLHDKLKKYVINGELTSGHARALLSVQDTDMQLTIADEIIRKQLNVRETENIVKKLQAKKSEKKIKTTSHEFQELENRFMEILGTKVSIISNKKKGKIQIEYYSLEELDRIIELMEKIVK